jgi:repressor LexA
MNRRIMLDLETENPTLRQAVGEARALLHDAAQRLNKILLDEPIIEATPVEAEAAISCAADAIIAALRVLDSAAPTGKATTAPSRDAPTRQQGQFLAYIHEYMRRNYAGVAPTHAALQKFFNLTAPSVNSMLNRLEHRGFLRRIPHQARGIELTIAPDLIPPLDRPFKM